MNNYRLIGILFLLLSLNIYSEEKIGQKTLNVTEAVDLAISNNLMLAQERISLVTKQRARDTTWNYFIPQVNLSATLSRPNVVPEAFSIPGIYEPPEMELTWNVAFGVSASLTLTPSMIYGIRQTIIDYESGNISYMMAERRITRDVKKLFYNLLLMQENITLTKQSIDAMGDRYEQAVNNYNNGLVSEYVKLSTQVAYENAKPGLQDLTIAYDSLFLSFKQLIGLDRQEPVILTGSIEPGMITMEKAELMALIEGRSDIRLQRKMVEMLKNVKDLKKSMLYPAFTVMFTLDPAFQGDPFSDPWFENIEEDWSQYSGRLTFMITVPIDGLLPFSKKRVDIAGANDAIKQAELGVRQIRQAAELEIESTFMKLQKSQKALDALRLNVQLAEKAYMLAEEAYNAGSKELLEVQNSELELNKARIEVLKEQYNYVMGILDLEYALNISLMEDNNEE